MLFLFETKDQERIQHVMYTCMLYSITYNYVPARTHHTPLTWLFIFTFTSTMTKNGDF